MAEKDVLSQLICLRLEYHGMRGQQRLRREDLVNVDASQIPPKQLASLGSKWIIDPKELRKLYVPIERADDICRRNAMKVMDVIYAFGESKYREIRPKVDECVAEFELVRASFANRIDDIQEKWKDANPEWKHIIAKASITSEDVLKRFTFVPHLFEIGTLTGDLAAGTNQVRNTLGATLFREIAELAEEVYRDSFEGRLEVTRRALRGILAAESKLESLSFIDSRIAPVLTRIRESLAALPKNGPIAGNDLNAVVGLLMLLTSEDRMMSLGEAVLNGAALNDKEDVEAEKTDNMQVPLVLLEQKVPVTAPAPRNTGFFL
jgi:hypothetical protein